MFFFNSLYERFLPSKDYKIHGYFEVINYQQNEIVNLKNTRVWLTNVFKGRHFNPYIKGRNQEGNFKQNNSKWCCSWIFKWFNKLQIIATDESVL